MNRETQPPTSTPEPGTISASYQQRPDGRGSHSAARGRSAGRHSGRGGQHRGRRSRWAATVGGAAALIAVAGGGYTVVQSATDRTDETRSAAGPAPVTDSPDAPGSPSGASATPRSTDPATPSPRVSVTATPSAQRPGSRPATTAPHTAGGPTGTAGTGKGAGTRKAPSSLSGGGSKTAQFAQQVLDLVNTERARQGCKPVTVNAKIQAAAQAHSDDMAARDYYEHDTPEGVGPGARMTSAGYHWSTWGENIYKSPKDAQSAMDGWMKSPGHRDNILNCAFKEIGVGINLSSNGPWWTQDFGAAS
ncbi:CAP domain-containing protein [Streptomyces sp. H39-S7]|uniref:CAP domain-containing protein n=1 Tax=Streptomyces sp. H39-S7 TaxID=3004357 RepID=UPI0022AEB32A|nr:CAP domain-containing protein [Streptomyces sp. H39-S7]MCZ4124557.1 CAP domain-containing protein [Streptomyces sp. H39-S7]